LWEGVRENGQKSGVEDGVPRLYVEGENQAEEEMRRPIDLIVGKIEELHDDKCAGWEAFYRKDYENEELREEIVRLKTIIRDLQKGIRKRYGK
jgi:hypothetical protein